MKSLNEIKEGLKQYEIVEKFRKLTADEKKRMAVLMVGKMTYCTEAIGEAFDKAGIDEGTVEFECPICGGTAVGNRYKHDGSYHSLGSGCTQCGWRTS